MKSSLLARVSKWGSRIKCKRRPLESFGIPDARLSHPARVSLRKFGDDCACARRIDIFVGMQIATEGHVKTFGSSRVAHGLHVKRW